MLEYPEHEKLKKVNTLSQTIGEFLEWADNQGILLCERAKPEDYYEALTPIREPRTSILARYFNIDLETLENEKVEMLRELRDENVRVASVKLLDQYGDTISELEDQ